MNLVDFARFLKAYRTIGIMPNNERAARVAQQVPPDAIFLSSSLNRAMQTAKAVTGSADVKSDKRYSELSFPLMRFPGTAKCSSWWRLNLLRLFVGFTGGPKNENHINRIKMRVREAVAQLIAESAQKDVVLFGHGVMNYLLAKELVRAGWIGAPRFVKHWDVLVLTKNA